MFINNENKNPMPEFPTNNKINHDKANQGSLTHLTKEHFKSPASLSQNAKKLLPFDKNWSLGMRFIDWKTFSVAPTVCNKDDKLSSTLQAA